MYKYFRLIIVTTIIFSNLIFLQNLYGTTKSKGNLEIICKQQNISIYLNDSKMKSNQINGLVSGLYLLRIEKKGFETWEKRIRIRSEADLIVKIDLSMMVDELKYTAISPGNQSQSGDSKVPESSNDMMKRFYTSGFGFSFDSLLPSNDLYSSIYGPVYGGNIDFFISLFSSNFLLQLSAGYNRSSVDENSQIITKIPLFIERATMYSIPVGFGITYAFNYNLGFIPYISTLFKMITFNEESKNLLSQERSATFLGLGYELAGGFRFMFNRFFGITGEFAWGSIKSKVNNVELNGSHIKGGFFLGLF